MSVTTRSQSKQRDKVIKPLTVVSGDEIEMPINAEVLQKLQETDTSITSIQKKTKSV